MEEEHSIEVRDDEVIITIGGETITISRGEYDTIQTAAKNEDVQKNIQKTFKTVEDDERVTSFGLTPSLEDEKPVLEIPRNRFPIFAHPQEYTTMPEEKRRQREEMARLIILKPWVDGSHKKWSFEWNGVPLSAYVDDVEFMDDVIQQKIRFGHNDIIDAKLIYFQDYLENEGVWKNDQNSFVVIEVVKFRPVQSPEL